MSVHFDLIFHPPFFFIFSLTPPFSFSSFVFYFQQHFLTTTSTMMQKR